MIFGLSAVAGHIPYLSLSDPASGIGIDRAHLLDMLYPILLAAMLLDQGSTYALVLRFSGCVIAYVLISTLIHFMSGSPATDISTLISVILGIMVVSITFAAPIRDRMRVLFGTFDTPDSLVTRMSREMETVLASADNLQTALGEMAATLQIPYASIALRDGTVASVGNINASIASTSFRTLPLLVHGQSVGELKWIPSNKRPFLWAWNEPLIDSLVRVTVIATYAASNEFRILRQHLIKARDEERRRLQRELHDGSSAVLTKLVLESDALADLLRADLVQMDEIQARVLALKKRAQEAAIEVRNIAKGLYPTTLSQLGLVGAIQECATGYEGLHTRKSATDISDDSYRKALTIYIQTPDDRLDLPASVELVAYRIIQAALDNVARHAGAQICHVQLRLTPDGHLPEALCARIE